MISLCLTNFNREQMLYEAFEQVLDDDRVSEIVISDDCSDYELYKRVVEHCKQWPKVKVYRNDTNIDCYRNKRKAVSLATNEWVIIFDSDNVITKSYIDQLCKRKTYWNYDRVLTPQFAKPHFDFRGMAGMFLTKYNIASYLELGNCQTMLNAMNYFVNRDEYLKVWDGSVDPVTSDSIYQNYNWLNSGNSIFVVPGLEYEHRVHNGSHYQNNVRRTPKGFHNEIVKKLKQMS